MSEDGYSALKTGVIWAGGAVLAVIVAVTILLGMRVDAEKSIGKYDACFEAGQTAAECSVALK